MPPPPSDGGIKIKVGLLVATNVTNVTIVTKQVVKVYWGLEHGLMNIWCEVGKDGLKTKGCRAHTEK